MSLDQIPTDLHGHSLFSDARIEPEDYVDFRAAQGLEVIALSDHDTFLGVRRAAARAKAHGVTLVPAMETTAFIHFGTEHAEQVHVLAYYPPSVLDDDRLERTALYERSLVLHAHWKTFVLEWLSRQSATARNAIDFVELEAMTPTDFPGLQSMFIRIHARHRDVFGDFHSHHKSFWLDDEELFGWSPETLMDAIRADGALDVVAHPNRIRDKERMARALEHASGIEVYTSRHTPEVAARFKALATDTGKHWTASTDDHQNARYVRPPEGTPRATVERILNGA